uniref:Uncharacterized protein n=1 Tax=Arundo donax TaxID=35708 RepID=A0A0A9AAI0_ARUDO
MCSTLSPIINVSSIYRRSKVRPHEER